MNAFTVKQTCERQEFGLANQETLEQQLDSFDPTERAAALAELAGMGLPTAAPSDNLNMHFHSFFSYNAEGWSPSRIAWEARKAGLYSAGLCDFDVLDGLDEFLRAGELLGLRATVNLETRSFVKEYADLELTSPGEPGVTYIMGGGFARELPAGSAPAAGLAGYRDAARSRNLALIDRVNPNVPTIALDYAADVLPLTPKGVATERHIIRAYINKSHAVYGTREAVIAFWSELLGKAPAAIDAILDSPDLDEAVRTKLAKKGGFGYVQPSEDTFPLIDDFMAWVASCGAVPMITWLDGTSPGESDGRALLECLMAKGGAALNIVPDRNWNISDPDKRAVKVANLRAIVQAADDLGLPVNIGTEMNKAGLPFVDDLDGEVLREFKASFVRGARIMVGHSIVARYTERSYATCECDLATKNRVFESIGALPPLTAPVAAKLRDMEGEAAFAAIKDAAGKGSW